MDAERTEIGTLGEFGLIAELTKGMKHNREETHLGVGDDAAVISALPGQRSLISTDLLCEGIHFDLTYVPLKHLGYKAVVVNLSDICAMSFTSCRKRRKWSAATSPVEPSLTLPGVCENASQIERPFPPSCQPPSI